MSEERWLPVPIEGYGHLYAVSDLGNILGHPRVVRWTNRWGAPCERTLPTRLLKPNGNRYLKVTLHDNEGRQITPSVHRLVLEAFVGPCPPGMEVLHGPGGQRDNRLVNLCYGTPSQNQLDKYRDGTMRVGTEQPLAKLTEDIVRECRMRYASRDGDTVSLAREYGVSQRAMWCAINGKTWRHVDGIPC